MTERELRNWFKERQPKYPFVVTLDGDLNPDVFKKGHQDIMFIHAKFYSSYHWGFKTLEDSEKFKVWATTGAFS